MFVSTKRFYACEGLELLWIITRDYWTRNAVLRRKITLYQEDDRDERKTEFFILQLIVQNDAEAREGFWEEPRAYISSFKFYQISSNGNKKFPLYIYILWKKTKKCTMTSIPCLHYLFIRHLFYQGPITWEISARAETECEGGNRCFLYFLLYIGVLRMRLWIFSPGWKCLAIASRNFQPGWS